MSTSSQYAVDPESRPERTPYYFNRELSWIEFNARVLDQALDSRIPLLERLRFLCIVADNFDEFFMVRVAGLKRQVQNGNHSQCPSGMTPREQLREISTRVHALTSTLYDSLHTDILPRMAEAGIVVRTPEAWTSRQRTYLARVFREQFFPVLTPVRCRIDQPLPYAGNMRLSAAFLLERRDGDYMVDYEGKDNERGDQKAPNDDAGASTADAHDEHIAVVPVPPSLPRLVYLRDKTGTTDVALIEDIIVENATGLFPGYSIAGSILFRVTRDADFGVDEARDEDFVAAMERVLEGRRRSQAVRLTVSGGSDRLRDFLTGVLEVHPEEVYEGLEPLEVQALSELADLAGYDKYRYEPWIPAEHPSFSEDEDVFECLKRGDALLYHPYERFSPVVRLVQNAADDPSVLAIKMTLYRTSGDSPIVRALMRAAENGKQVAAVVELKARFSEGQNIEWAEQLERAGVIVVYGVARLKVHAKALLIVRREAEGVRHYVHLGTGNYNEKTARLYSDLGYLTTSPELAWEVGQFFNAVTGYSVVPSFSRLAMAPVGLKARLLQLIHRETMRAGSEGGGHIMAKMNSLSDTDIIDALYDASNAGVTVDLNVRGICMLVPGVERQSEHIRVVSIVGRYLEHARAFYFANGGNEEIYLSSADWMPRNLERRVELLFPVEGQTLQKKVKRILELSFADTELSFELTPSGRYERRRSEASEAGTPGAVNSQQRFAENARAAASVHTPTGESELPVRRKPPRPRKGSVSGS
ncbi:MAG: polyphosphate kinase 1 [bacterium]